MANQYNLSNVNVGSAPNTGEGDLLRDAFVKINSSFANIYANGQFLANVTESRGAPGYSWEDDRNTGFYNPEDGVIIVSLNGTDSLVMRSNGLILWRGNKLTTQSDLNAALAGFTGGGGGDGTTDGGGASGVFTGIPLVDALPIDGNFEGRMVLNAQDGQVYIYQNGQWVLFKNTLTPDAPSGIEFVNDFPTDNLWEGRTVIKDGVLYIYEDGQWNDLLSTTTPVASSITGVEIVTSLPVADNFEGRQVLYNGELYIFYNSQWVSAAEVITPTASSITGVEIVTALPTADNFEGRQVLYDGQVYIYYNGSFVPASTVITPTASSQGVVEIITDPALPTTGNFEGRTAFWDDGLYIYVNGTWNTYDTYISGSGNVALAPNTITGNMIVDGAISARTIASNAIIAGKISAGSIRTQELATNAVSADKIQANAIVVGKIAAGAVRAQEIATDAVTSDKIFANAITAGKIAVGAVRAQEIAANAISSDKIVANAITGAKIQAGAVGTDQLAANAITANKIAANTITAVQIASRTITAQEIATGTISANEISGNAITADKIAANAITASKIAAGAITVDKIGSGTTNVTSGSFGLGVGSSIQGRPTVGFYQSTVNGQYPLVTYNSASTGFDAHGFVGAARSPNSYGGNFYNFGSIASSGGWARSFAFLAGGTGNEALAGAFGYYNSTYWNSTQSTAAIQLRTNAYICKDDFAATFEYRQGTTSSPQYTVQIAGTIPGQYYGAIVFERANNSGGLENLALLGYDQYAMYAVSGGGKIYAEDGLAPFTGIHEGTMTQENRANVVIGDIVVDGNLISRQDITNVRFEQELSSSPNQKGVIGIVAKIRTIEETAAKKDSLAEFGTANAYTTVQIEGESDEDYAVRLAEEAQAYEIRMANVRASLFFSPENTHSIDIAAVGEGQVNVCGEGGNIERGDLIVTSSIPGKGMKQADDIVRAYTVAKARESVTFASNTEVKTVACVYLCG